MYRWVWVVMCFVGTASAAPVVIYDSGQTQSITPYLEPVTIKSEPAMRLPVPSPSKPFNRSDLLPVHTPEMSPGRLSLKTTSSLQKAHLQYLSHPVFLLGTDDFSRRWLAHHRQRLQRLGAVGLLVQVNSEAELQAMQRLAGGLAIVPTPATELARLLSLRHYPVLISRQGIEQ